MQERVVQPVPQDRADHQKLHGLSFGSRVPSKPHGLPRLSKRGKAALLVMPIEWAIPAVDGRTIAGLARQGLVEVRPLPCFDGRSLISRDGRPIPRRVRLVCLSRLGRAVRDRLLVREARRVDRQLRGRRY